MPLTSIRVETIVSMLIGRRYRSLRSLPIRYLSSSESGLPKMVMKAINARTPTAVIASPMD